MRKVMAGGIFGLGVVLVAASMIGRPAPAQDTTLSGPMTVEALRERIHAGDVAAVAATLANLPTTTRDEQNHQRDLYGVFSESHPAVISFAKDWATASPENPAALTARGWSLFSQGWNFRGGGAVRTIYPDALQAFDAAHSEGLRLMQKAVSLKPDLLAASDGILQMSYTIGQRDLIAPEVARIMGILPNRGTMTISGRGFAPNWGGDVALMEGLCKEHAPKVQGVEGYGPLVCLVDGVMNSGSMTLEELTSQYPEVASVADNPLVREWANRWADVSGETVPARLAHFDKIKETRPLNYAEANIYDQNAEQLASITGEKRPPEFPAAVQRQFDAARDYADRNPGDWGGVKKLMNASLENKQINGATYDADDILARAQQVLTFNPYAADAWGHVGVAKLAHGDLDGVMQAEPYLINATVFSNHASEHLRMLGGTKFALFFRNMANAKVPKDPKQWQSNVVCPMVAQLRLLIAVCEAEGEEFSTCSGLPFPAENIQGQIEEIAAAGICEKEAYAGLETLVYQPVEVDSLED